eukprot:scaffold2601_cov285-Chaetoceros_neogracile.AAC.1
MTPTMSIYAALLVATIIIPHTQSLIEFDFQAKEQICPKVGTISMPCSRDYNPVNCGNDKCIYDNECLAQSASSAFIESNHCMAPSSWMCIAVDKTLGTEHDKGEYLSMDDNILTSCSGKKGKGLLCGLKKHVVDNMCTAKLIGWKKKNCSDLNGCHLARKNKCRNEVLKVPVICGELRTCQYSSQCLASSAGYNAETECEIHN